MGKPTVTEDTYIRRLPYSAITKLAKDLDPNNMWEKLFVQIPRKLNMLALSEDQFEPKYDFSMMASIEDKGRKPGASPTLIILSEWGTQNVQVKDLIKVLTRSELYAAADYLSVQVLHGKPVPRRAGDVSCQPQEMESCQKVVSENINKNNQNDYESKDTLYKRKTAQEYCVPCGGANSMEESRISLESGYPSADLASSNSPRTPSESDDISTVSKLLEENIRLRQLDFDLLKHITNNFDEREVSKGGNMIGRGGFGTVFIGQFNTGFKIAIKCLKEESEDNIGQFRTELEMLSRYRHENIVHLLGYSQDEPNYCLVYQYMPNGSLEDRLACKNETPPLDVLLRINIAKGTGRGISYLNNQGLVHRDIKSANVLLDRDFVPKVGDFATARVAPKGTGKTMAVETRVVIGTSAYLAPEAYQFDVSAKLDTFSFGVVLLELLTSLPSYDDAREEKDLMSYMDENCEDIMDLVDKAAGAWDKAVANTIFDITQECFKKKKQRPCVEDILPELDKL